MLKVLIIYLSLPLLLLGGCNNHPVADNKRGTQSDTNVISLSDPFIRNNLLDYQNVKYFGERNYINLDSGFRFIQELRYDMPLSKDEESNFKFELTLLDTSIAKTKKVLNLAHDSLIINGKLGFDFAWGIISKNNPKNRAFGQIEILEWSNYKITLKEDLSIPNFPFSGAKIYKGVRTFVREEKKHHNRKDS